MNTNKRLTKSPDKLVAGVCSGIADFFGWDPTAVRIAYAAFSIFSIGFPGLVMYLILWFVMPDRNILP